MSNQTPPVVSDSFFNLFQLPEHYALDRGELDQRYHQLQQQTHPDRHVNSTDAERRAAMQLAARINEGWRVLKDPLSRARHMLALHGMDIDPENNTAMPGDFLLNQLDRREAVAEARMKHDADTLAQLQDELRGDRQARYQALTTSFDQQKDYPLAAQQVRELLFLERLSRDINEAQESIEGY